MLGKFYWRYWTVVDIDTLTEIKKRIKRLESEKDKAQGRIEQLLKTLEEEFDCHNIEEAEELLMNKNLEQKGLEKKYKKELEAFMEKYGNKLHKE